MCLPRHSLPRVFLCALLIASAVSLAIGHSDPPSQTAASTGKPKVSLAVTVTDKEHHPVTELEAKDFALFEDDQPQQIASVAHSGIPVCIGLVVDNSGSMRNQRTQVIQALMRLVEAGNPEDRIFVVNFNDSPFLDQDFTTNHGLIEASMIRVDSRGGTALYDAVIASSDHLAQMPDCGKSALVVASDGEDNSSRKNLTDTLDAVRYSNSPVIYAVAMPNEPFPTRRQGDRHALEDLTAATGGAVFHSGNLRDLDKAALRVAAEIQNLYAVTYVPTSSQTDGNYHRVRVEVYPQERKDLAVRFRTGYVARQIQVRAPVAVVDIKPPADRGCMFGVVIDGDGKPVPRMIVHAVPNGPGNPPFPFARTDRDGNFRIDGMKPGSYLMSTENRREGYPPTALSLYRNAKLPVLTVNPGTACANIAITLGPKAAKLRLKVVDAGAHQQIFRFMVIVQRADDPSSTFSIPLNGDHGLLLPPSTDVTFWVQAEGYEKSEPMSLRTSSPDVAADLTVELKPLP